MIKRFPGHLCIVLAVMLAIASGCHDDPAAPQVGTLTINPEPDSIDAPWHLSGPNGFAQEGSGDTVVNGLLIGSYTVTWDEVNGYSTPEAQTLNLEESQSLTFTGEYAEPGLPFPDSPDQLMANFRALYEQMDFAEYRKMIHPDYTMILQESTRADFPDLGPTLTVDEELRMHERMFSKQDVTDPDGILVPGVKTVVFRTFERVDAWTGVLSGDPIPGAEFALYDVTFLFGRGWGYSTLKVQGAIKFYVTHRDSVVSGATKPFYQMYRQVDLTDGSWSFAGGVSGIEKAEETNTFGSVKALFR